jgi:hypothetical protein
MVKTMFKSHVLSSRNTKLIAIMLSISTAISTVNITPVSAQWFRNQPNNPYRNYPRRNTPQRTNNLPDLPNPNSYSNLLIVPAGTTIPVKYDKGEKILLTKEENLSLTLQVAEDIKNRQGKLLIPYGSEIYGKIQPKGNGSQFVAEYIILPSNIQKPFNANSKIITKTEIVDQGVNTDAILQGTIAGAAAATILAGVTGDTAIATEEVLGGAGFGALAGWLLGGRNETELISIDPNTDLNLILQSDFEL